MVDKEWICQLINDLGDRTQRIELLLDSINLRTTDKNARLCGTNWEVSEDHIAVWAAGETQPLTAASHYARFVNGSLEIRGGNFNIHTGEAGARMEMTGAGMLGYNAAGTETMHLNWTTGNLWAMKGGFGGTEIAPLIVLNDDGTATIAGWDITASALYKNNTYLYSSGVISLGTGNDIVFLSAVNATYRAWIGAADPGSAPFTVTKTGILTATGATITGTITATAGAIGGWTIAAAALTDTAGVVGMSSAVTGGDDVRFWAGNATPSSAPFRVTEAGALVATSASIAGEITATSGDIGGWEILATSIKDAAGVVGMSSITTGGDDVRFWAGNAVPTSAPFRVTEAGVLTATSGTVGGWTLAATTLTGGAAVLDSAGKLSLGTGNDIVILDAADAAYRLAIGNTTYASAPFRVTKAGVLTAEGASITGTLSSTVFTSGVSGWQIAATGDAEFNNIVARGSFTTTVFVKNLVSAIAGNLVVAKSSGTLATNYAVAGTMTIDAPPGGGWLFATGDIVRLKDYEGGASSFDTWVTVTRTGTENVYTTVLLAGTSPHTYNAGLAAVDYGASGQGLVQISADGTNAPWLSIATHAGSPHTTLTEKLRIGNLSGITDPLFGALSGYGVWTDNGYFTGKIKSTSGELGGWVLAATSLTDAAGVVGLSSAVTGGDDIRFWAGNATPASAPFRVTEAGALVATSATITGSITATTGTVGGWVISSASLADAAGVVGMSSAVTGGDDVRFWAGNATPSSAPFRVTEAGALVATSATISGSITATSGTIGGWTVGASTLTGGNATLNSSGILSLGTGNDVVVLDAADATYRLAIGNTTYSSAPFTISKSGVCLIRTSGAANVYFKVINSTATTFPDHFGFLNAASGASTDLVLNLGVRRDANTQLALSFDAAAEETFFSFQHGGDYQIPLWLSPGCIDTVTSGDNSANNFQATNWESQTVAVQHTGYITAVKIKLYRVGDPQDVTVSIRETAAGLPTGLDLSSATVDCTSITTSTTGEWITFTLTSPVLVIEGATYAIVVRAPSGSTPSNYANWRFSSTSIYSGGSRCYSTNSGSSWTAYATQDYTFDLVFEGGSLEFSGLLSTVRGGDTYQGWLYVPCITGIDGSGFNGATVSTTSITALTVSSVWSGVPAYAKGIVLQLTCKDSSASASLYFRMSGNSSGVLSVITVRPQVSNFYNDTAGIIPVSNNTVWWSCVASGGNTMTIYARAMGYFI